MSTAEMTTTVKMVEGYQLRRFVSTSSIPLCMYY